MPLARTFVPVCAPLAVGATYPFTAPPLPYPDNALVPYFDKATVRRHRDQAHQRHADRLNEALRAYPAGQHRTLTDLLSHLDQVPVPLRAAVRKHGGNLANYQLFWESLGPARDRNCPTGALAGALKERFGSFEAFQHAFTAAGISLFGAGWVFLVYSPNAEQVAILSQPNHSSAVPLGKSVLLGLDLWEQAYFGQYHHRPADYLAAWWHVVDWDRVSQRLTDFLACNPPQ